MKIKQEYKVREIAGENVVIMQGGKGADLTKIITLNESALLLWNTPVRVILRGSRLPECSCRILRLRPI